MFTTSAGAPRHMMDTRGASRRVERLRVCCLASACPRPSFPLRVFTASHKISARGPVYEFLGYWGAGVSSWVTQPRNSQPRNSHPAPRAQPGNSLPAPGGQRGTLASAPGPATQELTMLTHTSHSTLNTGRTHRRILEGLRGPSSRFLDGPWAPQRAPGLLKYHVRPVAGNPGTR
eukprot:7221555-Prymnesium_polylepis.1